MKDTLFKDVLLYKNNKHNIIINAYIIFSNIIQI